MSPRYLVDSDLQISSPGPLLYFYSVSFIDLVCCAKLLLLKIDSPPHQNIAGNLCFYQIE